MQTLVVLDLWRIGSYQATRMESFESTEQRESYLSADLHLCQREINRFINWTYLPPTGVASDLKTMLRSSWALSTRRRNLQSSNGRDISSKFAKTSNKEWSSEQSKLPELVQVSVTLLNRNMNLITSNYFEILLCHNLIFNWKVMNDQLYLVFRFNWKKCSSKL